MAVTVDATKGAYIIPALAGSGYVPLGGGEMTGPLAIASGTLTASAPALNITQTWTTGATFNSLLVNITDTSSAAASLLMDLQVSGASKFSVRKDGLLVRLGGANAVIDSTGRLVVGNSTYDTAIGSLWTVVAASGDFQSNVRTYPINFGGDVLILGDDAGVLAQRNGTNAQTLRVYSTYTDSSNYERLSLSTTAGSSVNITAETLGTGGDNLDIVLTPAGTGLNKFATGSYFGGSLKVSQSLAGSEDIYITHNAIRMSKWSTLGWNNANTGSSGAFDAGFFREAAGLIAVVTGASSTTYQDLKLRNLLAGGGNGSYVQTPSMTVTNLAAAGTAGAGARAFVTDATATTFLSTVAGGGANKVPVVSDGTNWLIG